jgi:hypothetical protein
MRTARRSLRTGLIGALAALGATLQAADAPPPALSVPVPDNGLATAKQDYEAVKAARSSVAVPTGLDLPKIPTPAIQLESALPPATPPAPRPAVADETADALKNARSGATQNWLLDAMEKEASHATPERSRNDDPRLRASENAMREAPRGSEREGHTKTKDADRDRVATPAEKQEAAALNPLAGYMTAWVAPRDRALLAPADPSLDATSLSALLKTADVAEPSPRLGPPASGNVTAPDGPPFSAGFVAGVGQPNPYLRDLSPAASGLDAPPVRTPAFAPVAPASASAAALPVEPAVPPAAAPTLAEQMKARDDEARAFRQLKRF